MEADIYAIGGKRQRMESDRWNSLLCVMLLDVYNRNNYQDVMSSVLGMTPPVLSSDKVDVLHYCTSTFYLRYFSRKHVDTKVERSADLYD